MKELLIRTVLGETLREMRTGAGLTLRDVSQAARISLGYLSEVERGHKEASSELIASIAAALGMPVSAVLAKTTQAMLEREKPQLAAVA